MQHTPVDFTNTDDLFSPVPEHIPGKIHLIIAIQDLNLRREAAVDSAEFLEQAKIIIDPARRLESKCEDVVLSMGHRIVSVMESLTPESDENTCWGLMQTFFAMNCTANPDPDIPPFNYFVASFSVQQKQMVTVIEEDGAQILTFLRDSILSPDDISDAKVIRGKLQ